MQDNRSRIESVAGKMAHLQIKMKDNSEYGAKMQRPDQERRYRNLCQ